MKYEPKHLRDNEQPDNGGMVPETRPDSAPEHVHPLGIPTPEPQDGSEFVPIPGASVPIPGSDVAPNGAVIRNPWSQQPEITPDHEYTPEQEDLNLLIM